MTDHGQLIVSEQCHDLHYVAGHRPLRVGFVIGSRFWLITVPAQVGADDRVLLRQGGSGPMPNERGGPLPPWRIAMVASEVSIRSRVKPGNIILLQPRREAATASRTLAA